MEITTDLYTGLITSEYANQPDFTTMIADVMQAFVDEQNVINTFIASYDIDTAVGAQLDILGLWIGAPRNISVPLNIYFSWDIAGLGWDQADWWVTGQALFTSTPLSDDDYRSFLKAKAAANDWDGTLYGAYNILAILFSGTRTQVQIVDNQNMTYTYQIIGAVPSDAFLAILQQDYLNIRPEGVALLDIILP